MPPVRALVQRVSEARVTVDGTVRGAIGRGLLVLVGVAHADDAAAADWLAAKVAGLRVFPGPAGRMDLDLQAVDGGALVIPQFTLYGDARRGRRPDFTAAAPPAVAAPLVERFAAALGASGIRVERGVFGAHMDVQLVNDGPVTLWLESPDRASAAVDTAEAP